MGRFAEKTSVSVERTKGDIESTLTRYGASAYMSGTQGRRAMVAFEMSNRRIVFQLEMPDPHAAEFVKTPTGRKYRSDDAAFAAWEQACRSRWRALLLSIRAKLEAVEVGITTFEDEFLAHIVMPDGMSVAEHVRPRIASAYESGNMQPLLPAPK